MAMVALASRCQILYECWQTRSCPLNLTIGMLIPPHALVSCLTRCRHAVKSKSRPPQLTSPGRYRVIYLNTNARALPATEASKLFETIATNLKEACRITVRYFSLGFLLPVPPPVLDCLIHGMRCRSLMRLCNDGVSDGFWDSSRHTPTATGTGEKHCCVSMSLSLHSYISRHDATPAAHKITM